MSQIVDVCAIGEIDAEDVRRFDFGDRSFAVYRSPDDRYYATDGFCTHERTHLADGLVMDKHRRVPKAQWRVRLHDRRGQGRAGLHQFADFSGACRGRPPRHRDRLDDRIFEEGIEFVN